MPHTIGMAYATWHGIEQHTTHDWQANCENTLHLIGMAYKMQTHATHERHGMHNMAWHRTTHYTRSACKLQKHTTLDRHGIQNANTCHTHEWHGMHNMAWHDMACGHTRMVWHTKHGMA